MTTTTPMHPLHRLLTTTTTAMSVKEYAALHELQWHKAIYAMPALSTSDKVVVGLGGYTEKQHRKSRRLIRKWFKDVTLNFQK